MSFADSLQDHIDLTPEQLCVLTGLMGYRRLYGLNCDETVYEIHIGKDTIVKQIVEELVTDKRLTYGLDGRFHISQQLYELVKTLGEPDKLLSFRSSDTENACFSLIKRNESTYMVTEIKQKNSVRFFLMDSFESSSLLRREMFAGKKGFEADILFADLDYVRKCVRGSDFEIAKNHLRKSIRNDKICSELMSLMINSLYSVSAVAQYRTQYGFRDIGGFFVTAYKNGTLKADIDSNSYVHFSPVTYDEVCAKLNVLLKSFFGAVRCEDMNI